MCEDWFQSSLLHTVTPWSIISQEYDKNLITLFRGDAMWLIEKVKKISFEVTLLFGDLA